MIKCFCIDTINSRPKDARIITGYEVWNTVLEQVSKVIDIFYFSSQIQLSEPKIFTICPLPESFPASGIKKKQMGEKEQIFFTEEFQN